MSRSKILMLFLSSNIDFEFELIREMIESITFNFSLFILSKESILNQNSLFEQSFYFD